MLDTSPTAHQPCNHSLDTLPLGASVTMSVKWVWCSLCVTDSRGQGVDKLPDRLLGSLDVPGPPPLILCLLLSGLRGCGHGVSARSALALALTPVMVPQTLFQDFRAVTQPRNSILQFGKLFQKRKGPECKILPPRGAARTGLNSLKGAPLGKGKARLAEGRRVQAGGRAL